RSSHQGKCLPLAASRPGGRLRTRGSAPQLKNMPRTYIDPITGAQIHQMTDHPSINHATYFLQSSFTPDNRTLIFTSYRTGGAQLFEIDFPDGEPRQLTTGAAIHPFSPAIHPGGRIIYFVR